MLAAYAPESKRVSTVSVRRDTDVGQERCAILEDYKAPADGRLHTKLAERTAFAE
jgi:hypothetical protein